MLVPGCTIGFRKTDLDCQGLPEDEKIICMREVALNYAFAKNIDPNGISLAESECDKIRVLGQYASWYVAADTYADLCYNDVAVYLADSRICDKIGQKGSTTVMGVDTSRELCVDAVNKENSFTQGKDSYKCGVLFLFPLILLGILSSERMKQAKN
ncbi:MAG: hypothetical protein WCT31_04535 [Candidatus Micrarchaeia archaeon]